MRVLITGGAGYIGSHTNRFFLENGVDTVVIDNLCAGHKEAVVGGKFIEGDFGNRELIDGILSSNIDAIVHFGAYADVADSVTNPGKYYRNNVANMLTLLESAAMHGVKYFIFSSSAATFGEPIYVPIDEKHHQKPINAYGMTKLVGEEMLLDFDRAYGIKSCSLRYFNASGASRDGLIGESHFPEHHIIPLLLQEARGGGAGLKVFGCDYDTRDGTCVRDYIHVEDLADAHWRALKHIMEMNISDSFNMGNGNGTTVLELIGACEKITGRKIKYDVTDRRQGDPAVLVASNEKVKKSLGWQPHYELEDILKDAWRWAINPKY